MGETTRRVLKMNGRNRESVQFDGFRFVPGDGLWRNGQTVPLPRRVVRFFDLPMQLLFFKLAREVVAELTEVLERRCR